MIDVTEQVKTQMKLNKKILRQKVASLRKDLSCEIRMRFEDRQETIIKKYGYKSTKEKPSLPFKDKLNSSID